MNSLDLIKNCLEEMKVQDLMVLPVSELTSITDTMIICTGRSNRHLHAVAEKVAEECKKNDISPIHVSGQNSDEWIIVDCFDVIVHIMVQEARDFYQLEKIWSSMETRQQQG